MTERIVLGEELQQAEMQICLFHVLRTMKRETTTDKLGITPDKKETVLEIVQNMGYVRNDIENDQHYQHLEDTRLDSVITYIDDNWCPVRKQWVEGLKRKQMSLSVQTNNRLQSTFQKLESITSPSMTLLESLMAFFNFFKTLRTERDHRSLGMFQKMPTIPFEQGSTLHKFNNYVTTYALQYIQKQLQYAPSVTIEQDIDETSCQVRCSEGLLVVTLTSCECSFHTSLQLPCRHTLHFRDNKGKEMLNEDLIHKRWTRVFYRDNHRILTAAPHTPSYSSVCATTRRQPLLHKDKFQKLSHTTQHLASLTLDCGMVLFKERLRVLDQLLSLWEKGKVATVLEVIMNDEPEHIALTDIDVLK